MTTDWKPELPQDASIERAASALSAAAWLPADRREHVRASVDDWLAQRFFAMTSEDTDALAALIGDIETLRAIDPKVTHTETLVDLKRVLKARKRKLRARVAAVAGVITPPWAIASAALFTALGEWNPFSVATLMFITALGLLALRWTRGNGTYYYPSRGLRETRVHAARLHVERIADALVPRVRPAMCTPVAHHGRTAPRARQHRPTRRRSTVRSGLDPGGDPEPWSPAPPFDAGSARVLSGEGAPC